ncbi:hypothetical protein BT69DRAFT_1348827 [Atractiella rhizophila]|nr:hypothetical protein BT69DRAFT_1348827 [Atractiella rhizophila]
MASALFSASSLILLSLVTAYYVRLLAFHPPEAISNFALRDIIEECVDEYRDKMIWIDQGWYGGGDLMCILVTFFKTHIDQGQWIAKGVIMIFVALVAAFSEFIASLRSRSWLLGSWLSTLCFCIGQFMAFGVTFPAIYVPFFIIDRFFMQKKERYIHPYSYYYRSLVGLGFAAITFAMTFLPTNSDYWIPICIAFQYAPIAYTPLAFLSTTAPHPTSSALARAAITKTKLQSSVAHVLGISMIVYGVVTKSGKWNDATQFLVFDYFGILLAFIYLQIAERLSDRTEKTKAKNPFGLKAWILGPGTVLLDWVEENEHLSVIGAAKEKEN